MGGKSTLLRQVCLAVIMAQIGCYVAATKCRLTPVDKVFTRVGARDSILEGKSTFLVELEETATMLKQATSDTLCIVDELGRGTSTFDGAAIAMSTAEYLSQTLKSRCLFATHYHLLCEECSNDPHIFNFHMSIAPVDSESNTVTFLYKFSPGSCLKSHGLHVARLAGLPDTIANVASKTAEAFVKTSDKLYKNELSSSLAV
eukprot:CAMPEP_0113849958 /NCGR_PEP_ID=MMETSP0372-20130328/3506_1 /TAXON_ID=340204 /ORGANISM="Lankesteria abbotti" /LENGTH=201 /DNA_ID=CAMNT_0000819979 /DNA_START=315 /DNA_END=920 /DNA_ORIENTATION=- /assembly_acc=CAM_ASM_000359